MSKSTISLLQLFQMFPDAETARGYMEARRWHRRERRRDGPQNGAQEHQINLPPMRRETRLLLRFKLPKREMIGHKVYNSLSYQFALVVCWYRSGEGE
jgi:hypothetical protein